MKLTDEEHGKLEEVFDVVTVEWQCTECNHLCKLLLDRYITPSVLNIKCGRAEPKFKGV